MTQTDGVGAKLATLHLLAVNLAPSVSSLGMARPALEQAILQRIRQYIAANLASPDLDTPRICAEFRISRSALYRLFEPLGGVSRYIRDVPGHAHAHGQPGKGPGTGTLRVRRFDDWTAFA